MKVVRKPVPAEIRAAIEPEAEVELSVSITIGRRNKKGDFRSITIRSGENRPCELGKLDQAHDAAWTSIRDKIRKRFPQAAKLATELEE